MSAYVVDKAHINAMLQFGTSPAYQQYGAFSWYYKNETHYLSRENANEVGQMLLDENVRSVCYRYPDDSMANLPGRNDAEWLLPFKPYHAPNQPTPIDILRMTGSYKYQSCEHPEWEESEAFAFCDALRSRAIHLLPGYDDAIRDWTPKNDGGTRSPSLILGS